MAFNIPDLQEDFRGWNRMLLSRFDRFNDMTNTDGFDRCQPPASSPSASTPPRPINYLSFSLTMTRSYPEYPSRSDIISHPQLVAPHP